MLSQPPPQKKKKKNKKKPILIMQAPILGGLGLRVKSLGALGVFGGVGFRRFSQGGLGFWVLGAVQGLGALALCSLGGSGLGVQVLLWRASLGPCWVQVPVGFIGV